MAQYYRFEWRYSGGDFSLSTLLTPGVRSLILWNTGIFAVTLILEPLLAALSDFWGIDLVPAKLFGFQPAALLQGYVWKLLTYGFVHAFLSHLFFNMLWLYFFGPEVERALGTRIFIRFYLLAVVLSVLATLPGYFIFHHPTSVVGSSGAVMAVLVAFATLNPYREFVLFPLPIPINAMGIVLLVIVLNLISALNGDNTSVETHFGGMLFGYLFMKGLPRYRAWQRERLRSKMKVYNSERQY
jgi:membrane associated rhomboid family serine protease